MKSFKVHSQYQLTGDQPQAVEILSKGIKKGLSKQVLLGVTGSGKTFTMANVIEKVQKPTLVIAHNKTLAAQLCSEFKEFFPENSVGYFVSYYDYYQPEAYIARTDTYIEKDAEINDEIDKLRHSATAALFERKDVIIVASVSCIYGLGDPVDYANQTLSLRVGMEKSREDILRKLVDIQYTRNDVSFTRGTFRVRGDSIDILPADTNEKAIRIELFGDEIDRIMEIDVLTGEILGLRDHVLIFPASHHVTSDEKVEQAIANIEAELEKRIQYFKERDMLIEAQRIEQRTRYDIEMMREVGTCKGIENYSRHLSQRETGSRAYTLMDYFPDDFLIIIDESHVTIPQIRGMHAGDQARKKSLIEFGFRLPSALDNRPLNFQEFESMAKQVVFVSATPGPYEKEMTQQIAEQIIRPTGLMDPEIIVRPSQNQIDDLMMEIDKTIERTERVLVTTLTKKMSERLTDYLKEAGIKVQYLHSDVETLERIKIIQGLRLGEFDVLVGINLLREGLDLPEVSLVAILDADKEGFLRSETALVQTIGRAARNINGHVVMYADKITKSMKYAIDETERRRMIQKEYNLKHGITPAGIIKDIRAIIEATKVIEETDDYKVKFITSDQEELGMKIEKLKQEMEELASKLQFEKAAEKRDQIKKLEEQVKK